MTETQASLDTRPNGQMPLHLQKLLELPVGRRPEKQEGRISIRKLSSSGNPQQISVKLPVPRRLGLGSFSQVLCDRGQRRVPLRKEEGDEILRKLLTMRVMDVSISSPEEVVCFHLSLPHVCDRRSHFLFSLALWQNWYFSSDINICLPFGILWPRM